MSGILRVGIFGFYSYGNLGDNLMAYLVSERVREAGHEPIVFCRDPHHQMNWGVRICADLQEFAQTVDVVIFGGGGLLIPRHRPSGIGLDFNKDLRAILDASKARDIPLFGFSLGGAGAHLQDIVPIERRELVERLAYVTLRNREDVHLLAEAGTEGEFLDDIVWSTANKLPQAAPAPHKRPRIGVNLYFGNSSRRIPAKIILWLASLVRKDVDFIFYDIHPEEHGVFGAFETNGASKNCDKKFLIEIEEACREVSSLDLLLTTRLHLGVMAMSYGVPSIAYAGAEKTRLLYNRIGRGAFFWKTQDILKMLVLFLVPGKLKSVMRSGEQIVPSEVTSNAMLTYDRIGMVLDRVTKSALVR